MTKRLLLITLLIAACFQYALAANTYDFESEHIYYQLTSENTVAVSGIDDIYFHISHDYDGYTDFLDVDIPSSVSFNGANYEVTAIADSAFYGDYAVGQIIIPETVTSIGKAALKGRSVKCLAIEPPAMDDSFDGNMLLVPESALVRYKEASGYTGRSIFCYDGEPSTLPTGRIFTYADNQGCVIVFENCGENTEVYEQHGYYTAESGWQGWSSFGQPIDDPNQPNCIDCYLFHIPRYYTIEAYAIIDNQYYVDLLHVEDLALCNKDACWDFYDGEFAYSFGESGTSSLSCDWSSKYAGDIVIPSSAHFAIWDYEVTCIGTYPDRFMPFSDCENLNSVTIPASVQTIYDSFHNCPNLLEITCLGTVPPDCRGYVGPPDGELGIGFDEQIYENVALIVPHSAIEAYRNDPTWGKFQNFVDIGTDVSPHIVFADDNVKMLCIQNWDRNDDGVFSEAEAATVKSLKAVFSGNTAISSFNELKYFTGLTSIGNGAFSGCTELTNIIIPNSVVSIGDRAFNSCRSLPNIDLPNSVTTIGNSAFSGCSGLTSIDLPNSVTTIGSGAFTGCEGLSMINIVSGNPKYDSRENSNAIIETSTNTLILGCKNTVIPNSVTSIGENAFSGCKDLTSIDLPLSITTIGSFAFYGCSGLTSIDIPNSVTTIGRRAFYGCSALISATLGTSVTSIGDNAFQGCTAMDILNFNAISCSDINYGSSASLFGGLNISTIHFGNNVQRIPTFFAYGLKRLTDITIPNSVTTIGSCAFAGCSGLTSIIIPSTVISISSSAFGACEGLSMINVASGNPKYDSRDNSNAVIETSTNTLIIGCKNTVIPSSVTSIGDYAFSGCSGLTSIDIPNTVTTIGYGAFMSCGLINVTLPESITTISGSMYLGCRSLTDIVIPNTVTEIGDQAFSTCDGLKRVTIPNSVTSIEDLAFGNNYELTAVYSFIINPSQMSMMSSDAFWYSYDDGSSIPRTLYVPVGSLAEYQADYKWSRYFVNIMEMGSTSKIQFADQNVKALCVQNWDINGDGELSQDEAAAVTSLNSVFKGNSSITSFNELAYFTGLTSIQINEFMNCTKLTSVVLPNSVTSIGEGAFTNCTALNSVSIPNSVTTIGGAAFFNCSKLASVTIPVSVTDIGGSAFQNCLALRTLNFNAISCADFSSMSSPFIGLNISTINFGDSVQRIPAHFVCGLENMKSLTIPNSVTSIGDYAFDGCFGLTNITFGESLEIIGNSAFYGCEGLTSLVLPQSLTSVQEKAFEDCSNIVYVKCLGAIPASASQNSFDEMTYQNASLCVPNDAVEAYRQAEGWKKFLNIGGVYDFEQDGLYYKITNNGEVSLTTGPQPYSGSVMVPAKVTFDGETYAVTGIDNGTFANAELSNLYLPVTIGNIGEGAFVGCNIQSLYITGAGSWQAGALNLQVNNLFIDSGVTGLAGMQIDASSIYCYATVPPACDDQTFQSYNADLHVPASSLAAYFTAPYWCNFLNIIGDAVELTEFTLSDSSLEMPVGGQATLRATIKPTNATVAEVTWGSSNEAVATVTGGVVTGIAAGECDIIAISQSQRAVCHMVVYDIPATGITISQETAKMEMGTQLTLTATVLPEDATDKTVTWLSDNEAVATVAEGVVTAVGTGECNITANCAEFQAICHVIVVEHLISITLDEHEISILPNHIIILTPTISPVSTDLVVTSTNPNVAAVRLAGNKIQVVGIAEGTTTIYVNSADGYAEGDSCEVTVITEIGDVNNDGFVDINDVTTLIDRVLGKNQPLNSENADVNYDGNIDINDVTDLIGAVLGTSQLVPKDKNTIPITVNGVTFKMVRVNGGTFTMGATAEQGGDALEWENPAHQVTLSDYAIGQTEVTQALWEAVMGSNPSLFTSDPNRPVERVTWDECQEFITRLNALTGKRFRLPTEAEWEFAARGGNKSQGYKYAGSNNIDEVAWYLDNSYAVGSGSPDYGTHIVGTQKANELGLYDMSGNVWEWCQDYFGDYGSEAQFNPTGPETGTNRMRRGGGWDLENASCRVSHRSNRVSTYKYNNQGLRLAL